MTRLNRKYSPEDVEEKINTCIANGILPDASFMIGMPWETKVDIQATFDLINRINTPHILLNLFTPFIGTPVYRNPDAYGVTLLDHDIEDEEQLDNGAVFHSTAHLTAEEIRDLWIQGSGLIFSRAKEKPAYDAHLEKIYQ
jgi:radical SAM superfamily enzyme YgiQ (UPF0313 family)